MEIHLPLQWLVDRWESEVEPLVPRQKVILQQVLRTYGTEIHEHNQLEELQMILGPLFAKNAEQQDRFKQIFEDEYLPFLRALEVLTPIDGEPLKNGEEEIDQEEIKKKVKSRRTWLVAAGVILLMITAFLLRPRKTPPIPVKPVTDKEHRLPGETKPDENIPPKDVPKPKPDFRKKRKDIPLGLSFVVENSGFPKDRKDTRQPLNLTARGEGNQLNFKYLWHINDTITREGRRITHWFKNEGFYQVRVVAFDSVRGRTPALAGDSVMASETIYIPEKMVTREELRDLAFAQIHQKQKVIKIILVVLAIILIISIEGYLFFYRNALYNTAFHIQFDEREHGPYTLSFPDQSKAIKPEQSVYDLARTLKTRREADIPSLNIQKTLYQTIQSGGLPSLVYDYRTTAAEYLILVDETSTMDQQAAVFKSLIETLVKEEVPIHWFSFRNYPGRCFSEKYPEGIDLHRISQQHYKDRLLIFSPANHFVNPVTMELSDWVEDMFEPWEEKIILTPDPVNKWGTKEKVLEAAFHILPADIESQLSIVEALVGEENFHPEKWESQTLVSTRKTPLEDYNMYDLHDLQSFLGPDLFGWLSAAMVYPKPVWEITLAVGKALEEDRQEEFVDSGMADVSFRPGDLVNFTNLYKLAQIPWLKTGDVPDSLRNNLIQNLEDREERVARKAILKLLDQTQLPESSLAWQEKQVQKTIQLAKLSPENKLLQRKMRYLWANDLLDFHTSEQMAREHRIEGYAFKINAKLPSKKWFGAAAALLLIPYFSMVLYRNSPSSIADRHFKPASLSREMNLSASTEISAQEGNEAYNAFEFQKAATLWEKAGFNSASSFPQGIFLVNAYLGADNPKSAINLLNQFQDGRLSRDQLFMRDWYMIIALLKDGREEEAEAYMRSHPLPPEASHWRYKRMELFEGLHRPFRYFLP